MIKYRILDSMTHDVVYQAHTCHELKDYMSVHYRFNDEWDIEYWSVHPLNGGWLTLNAHSFARQLRHENTEKIRAMRTGPALRP